ncbi:MAG TPA: DUF6064 family protein, partial [Vicinamibacterales bacterium]|nr:DUF6064 family protein [Vicinamibacterales bacterium]
MNLPFTHEQFLDVFASYNTALWPAALVLWLLTALAVVAWLRAGDRGSRALAGVLALHWAWSAVAYHAAFFRQINPAASLFAALFLVQAGLFAWFGVVRGTWLWRFEISGRGGLAL